MPESRINISPSLVARLVAEQFPQWANLRIRSALSVDDATWARGRGWALRKALITLAEAIETHSLTAEAAQQTIGEIVVDYKGSTRK